MFYLLIRLFLSPLSLQIAHPRGKDRDREMVEKIVM